jgi:hypothetical protein
MCGYIAFSKTNLQSFSGYITNRDTNITLLNWISRNLSAEALIKHRNTPLNDLIQWAVFCYLLYDI